MANRSTDTSGAGLAHGSSTGAPGIPTGVQDQRAQYDPNTTGVNPSTGAAYSKTRAGSYSKPDRGPSPSNSYDTGAGDARMQHPPSTSERVRMEQQQEKAVGDQSKGGQAGQDLGRKAQGVMAGVHVSYGYFFLEISRQQAKFLTLYTVGRWRISSWSAYICGGSGVWIG